MKSSVTKLLLLGLTGTLPAGAASFSFGNAIFSSASYNSDGSNLEQGTDTRPVTFELGIFQEAGSEFAPNLSNIDDWADNFIPLSTAPIAYDPNSGGGYITGGGSFGTATGQIDNTTAPEGYRVYLWGYQNKTVPTSGNTVDWLLVTGDATGDNPWSNDEWVVPDSATTDQSDLERQWTIKTANTAVVGSIMGSTGEGDIETPQTLGMNDVQFAAVPEPSSLLLALLASTTLLRRRRS